MTAVYMWYDNDVELIIALQSKPGAPAARWDIVCVGAESEDVGY
jgi:hypothetical protein